MEEDFEKLQVEDFDNVNDTKFIREVLTPYLTDMFKDLALRSTSKAEKKLDKVVFTEYCLLPGILSDRVFRIFDDAGDGLISEESFVKHFVMIFMSDLEQR